MVLVSNYLSNNKYSTFVNVILNASNYILNKTKSGNNSLISLPIKY